MEWKYSSVGFKALSLALKNSGGSAQVLPHLSQGLREALERPMQTSWHDGSLVVELSVVVERELGSQALEKLYYEHVKRSIGPFMEPFIRVVLLLGGRNPATLLSRMNDTLRPVMKGVSTTWTPSSDTSGQLVILHHDDVQDASFSSWAGALRYIFDLCGVAGTITPKRPCTDHRTFAFDVSWAKA